MKTTLTIILIIFSSIIGYSQTNEFAPIGAKWYYTQCDYSPSNIGYILYESYKDSIIDNQLCKALKKTQYLTNGNIIDLGYEFIYYSDSILFYWNFGENNFVKMCDFKAKQGDTLNVNININDSTICDSVSLIIVDSVKFINIDDNNLKTIYISYTLFYSNNQSEKIRRTFIEKIGCIEEFIFQPFCGMYDIFCEINPYLRCYEDSTIIYKSDLFNYPCDTLLITDIESIFLKDSDIIVYPNPFNDKLTIKSNSKINQLILYNTYGFYIKSYSLYNNIEELNLTYLASGIYYFKVISNYKVQTIKIIKL